MALLARPQVKFEFQIYLRGEVPTLMRVIDMRPESTDS